MRCLGRSVGCFLLVVTIIATPMALWIFTIWNVASNADLYTESLDEEAYTELATLVLPVFAELVSRADMTQSADTGLTPEQETESAATPEAEPEPALEPIQTPNAQETFTPAGLFADVVIALDHDDWREIINGAIDPLWVRDLLNTNLKNTLAFVRYETDELTIQVDLTPIANMIEGEPGDVLIGKVIDSVRSWDECNETQRAEMLNFVQGQTRELPHCNPGDDYLAQLHIQMLAGKAQMVSELDKFANYQFDLREELASRQHNNNIEEVDQNLHEFRRGLFFIDHTLVLLLLIPVMLLALVMIFSVRSLKDFFFWMGVPAVGVGILTVFPLIPWAYGLVQGPNKGHGFFNNNSEVELWFQAQRWIFGAFAEPILGMVIVLLLMGLVFLILAGMLRGPEKRKEQPVYYVIPGGSTQQPNVFAPQAYLPSPGVQPPQPPNPLPHPPSPFASVSPPASSSGSSPVKVITPKPSKAMPAKSPPASEEKSIALPASEQAAASQPESPKPTTGAERFKEVLDKPDLGDDQTFIPTEPPSPGDEEPYTPKNKLSED